MRSPWSALLAFAAAAVWAAAAQAQFADIRTVRFVDLIELSDHDDQADIAIRFNCSMRYITHLPASPGQGAAHPGAAAG